MLLKMAVVGNLNSSKICISVSYPIDGALRIPELARSVQPSVPENLKYSKFLFKNED
jgi:hypothetical protein